MCGLGLFMIDTFSHTIFFTLYRTEEGVYGLFGVIVAPGHGREVHFGPLNDKGGKPDKSQTSGPSSVQEFLPA